LTTARHRWLLRVGFIVCRRMAIGAESTFSRPLGRANGSDPVSIAGANRCTDPNRVRSHHLASPISPLRSWCGAPPGRTKRGSIVDKIFLIFVIQPDKQRSARQLHALNTLPSPAAPSYDEPGPPTSSRVYRCESTGSGFRSAVGTRPAAPRRGRGGPNAPVFARRTAKGAAGGSARPAKGLRPGARRRPTIPPGCSTRPAHANVGDVLGVELDGMGRHVRGEVPRARAASRHRRARPAR